MFVRNQQTNVSVDEVSFRKNMIVSNNIKVCQAIGVAYNETPSVGGLRGYTAHHHHLTTSTIITTTSTTIFTFFLPPNLTLASAAPAVLHIVTYLHQNAHARA